jgi:hypothetical protein
MPLLPIAEPDEKRVELLHKKIADYVKLCN